MERTLCIPLSIATCLANITMDSIIPITFERHGIMSSLAPSKRELSTNTLPSKTGVVAWFKPLLASTVGQKMLVAITGILLTGFVIAHMVGNLKVFAGRDSLNTYAQFLKDLGPLLWIARIGLLGI